MNEIKNMDQAMEFVMSELHKEWDRTGATKASVFISLDEVEDVNRRFVANIAKRHNQAERAIDFEECIGLSRENYILLRLVRKLKEEIRTNRLARKFEFVVELDEEELNLFRSMFQDKI